MSEEPLKIGQRKITEIVPKKNKSGLSVYRTCFGDFCRASDVDLVIAAKDNEIRQLKRALYKALTNLAKERSLYYYSAVPNRRRCRLWEKVETKCRAMADKFKDKEA